MMSISFLGTPHILTYSAHPVQEINESYSGMHDVRTADSYCLRHPNSSALESRPVQSITVRYIPVQTTYSPDGRILIVFSSAKTMYCLRFGKQGEDSKEQWHQTDTPGVRDIIINENHSLE